MTSQHPALGIDYGEARIGIAATDPVGIMAHPVETIHRQQTDAVTRIVQIVQERGIRTLVLGLPCLLYTSPSPRDRSVSRMPSSA